ncbi:MAG: NAD(+) synthase [Firmicutes bacterium]|nr:NAD(+) synthase [Bacillota bacterium]
MKSGQLKIALATPNLRLGAVISNTDTISKAITDATKAGASIVALPLLCISGGFAEDMGHFGDFQKSCHLALETLTAQNTKHNALVILSLPIEIIDNSCDNQIRTMAAFIKNGKVLALTIDKQHGETFPKTNIVIGDTLVPITDYPIVDIDKTRLGVVFGEDFDSPTPHSLKLVQNGTNLIINLGASQALIGSFDNRQSKIAHMSQELGCTYAYVSGGAGMSVSNTVYSGDKIFAQNGHIISASTGDDLPITVSNLQLTASNSPPLNPQLSTIHYPLTTTTRLPYVPTNPAHFDEAMDILVRGIKGRMEHINVTKVIFGLSGGLDSAMTLCLCAHMAKKYKLSPKNIICVTMGGLASSSRTANNADKLIKLYGVTGLDIPITNAVTTHLKAIGHNGKADIAYENTQARERTKIILDLANMHGALVLGTGDLSEIALGWSTYGGDQLAQYNPNSSLSKTFIRAYLRHYATKPTTDKKISAVMTDILATPISPELKQNQDTEKEIGPYELHDFFLYYMICKQHGVADTINLCYTAYPEYDRKVILATMRKFLTRFFSQQFKRLFGCDGIQITPHDLTNLQIKTDFSGEVWLKELDDFEKSETSK